MFVNSAATSHLVNRSIEGFAPHISGNSIDSARAIVPVLLDYAQPGSVVDFGCKHGEWLMVFKAHGVTRVLGFDQPKRRDRIIIEPAEFRAIDLTKRFDAPGPFDLAVCIEVVEHLPQSAADTIVAALTAAAPLVLFSAAVPHQGGHGHLNEQPRRYWRDKFAARGYRCLDCIRPRIWQDPNIAWWYRQNLFLYANDDALSRYSRLRVEADRPVADDVDLMHVQVVRRQSLAFRVRQRLAAFFRR